MLRYLFFFLLLFPSQIVLAQLTIIVEQLPEATPALDAIYIAGDFQGWNPNDPAYQLTKNAEGLHEITFEPQTGNIAFKFTRGSWENTEGNAAGQFLPNRTFNYSGNATTIRVTIASWEDVSGTANSTAAENVHILDDDFPINALNRTRRIWIYLPPDYAQTNKKYPVLYLQDGQNAFDAATSFSGEWQVDESLNRLFEAGDYGCIVVAIDNGQAHRIDEYTPWPNPEYGGGEGDEYLSFIVNELKPVIDANYHTLSSREFTGIMGSSLGGLISHFGFVEYPTVFGKAGIFSPSYWFSDNVYSHTATIEKAADSKIYLLGGQNESATLVAHINRMEAVLKAEGFAATEIKKVIHPDGAHSEWYWAREFSAAYEWLFGDLNFTTSTALTPRLTIRIFPNPTDSLLHIEGLPNGVNYQVEIVSLQGQPLKRMPMNQSAIALDFLPSGFYIVKVWAGNQVVFSERVMVNR